MFEPSAHEIQAAGDLLSDLLREGRALMRTPEAHKSRLEEQQAEAAARGAAQAARMMERMQWRPRASVAMVTVCTCKVCGNEARTFAGFGVAMFRNSDQSERIVITQGLDKDWPRETHVIHSTADSCLTCMVAEGFEAKNGTL